ncbi:reverse transcriptase domain-containing protein [Artemisia annua]|uniref:Reverse transcriptase domain-containing protein n=1 Tax=Artemisia annua TaxID=35608 RepID=A0A2U1KUJ8_ARTAN|nr:reverse transcriptase domain-containing protein [Artemisia annua]
MKLREGLFSVDIRRPPLGAKLLEGAVSRDVDFISGLTMRRAANVVDLMSLLPQLHDPQSELLLLRSFIALGSAASTKSKEEINEWRANEDFISYIGHKCADLEAKIQRRALLIQESESFGPFHNVAPDAAECMGETQQREQDMLAALLGILDLAREGRTEKERHVGLMDLKGDENLVTLCNCRRKGLVVCGCGANLVNEQ